MHFMGTFVVGFAVGFGRQWRLALMTIAVIPLISVAGFCYANARTRTTARSIEAYAKAGTIAEQVCIYVPFLQFSFDSAQIFSRYVMLVQKSVTSVAPCLIVSAGSCTGADGVFICQRIEIYQGLRICFRDDSEAWQTRRSSHGVGNGFHLRSAVPQLCLPCLVWEYSRPPWHD